MVVLAGISVHAGVGTGIGTGTWSDRSGSNPRIKLQQVIALDSNRIFFIPPTDGFLSCGYKYNIVAARILCLSPLGCEIRATAGHKAQKVTAPFCVSLTLGFLRTLFGGPFLRARCLHHQICYQC